MPKHCSDSEKIKSLRSERDLFQLDNDKYEEQVNKFSLTKSIEILERTPNVVRSMLSGLSDMWLHSNEGRDSWSPFIIVGHFIHGEKTDWIPRLKTILEFGESRPFVPFDRFAQFEATKGKTLSELLAEFESLRHKNVHVLKNANLQDADLSKSGIHPEFGLVTLKELLAAWVVHDLGHIRQIARVMAKQYRNEIGPWQAYLPVVHK